MSHLPQIRVVLFDLDRTLVDHDTAIRRLFQAQWYAEHEGVPCPEADGVVHALSELEAWLGAQVPRAPSEVLSRP